MSGSTIIDVDRPVTETPDVWTSRVPDTIKDRVPRMDDEDLNQPVSLRSGIGSALSRYLRKQVSIPWIPACAGMTTGWDPQVCHSRQTEEPSAHPVRRRIEGWAGRTSRCKTDSRGPPSTTRPSCNTTTCSTPRNSRGVCVTTTTVALRCANV